MEHLLRFYERVVSAHTKSNFYEAWRAFDSEYSKLFHEPEYWSVRNTWTQPYLKEICKTWKNSILHWDKITTRAWKPCIECSRLYRGSPPAI